MAKKLFRITLALFLGLGSLSLFTNCNDDDDGYYNDAESVYDLVKNSKDHKILLTAIQEADLVGTLKSLDASYTLFAPTDAAFDKLPEGALEGLLGDPITLLQPLLLYHVTGTELPIVELTNGLVIEMADGLNAMISVDGRDIMINNAMITSPDFKAQNGVLYSIDEVLTPPSNSVAEEVASNESLMTLTTAISATGLDEALSDEKASFTLFAPTNAAFDELPVGTVNALLSQPQVLTDVLLYHALSKDVYSSQLSDTNVKTINGADVAIKLDGGNVYVNNAQVEVADIICTNGVIHIISKVLIPPTE